MFVTWDTFFTPEEPSIARELNKRGYTTGFVGKWPNMDEVLADLERDRTYAESTGKRRRVGWQGGERPEAHRFRKGVASTNDRRC